MANKNYGSIVIVNDKYEVLGLMTERDIFRRVVAEELDPSITVVSEIMTSEIRTAKETDKLSDWLRIMSNERFRRLPVVDSDNRLVSVMSQGDFVSYTWPQLVAETKEKIGRNFQTFLIVSSILVYTLILLVIVPVFIR
jgi:signal-transduction protein with cAMP-binding, CBS, and nucleotidyltransferase domain